VQNAEAQLISQLLIKFDKRSSCAQLVYGRTEVAGDTNLQLLKI
jgi:hypothetical protein